MRVLVTGGAGFIGAHIVSALIGRGHEPVVLDALLPTAHHGPPALPGTRFVHGDVRDTAVLATVLRGVDAVCHQAAMVGLGKDFAGWALRRRTARGRPSGTRPAGRPAPAEPSGNTGRSA